jgi:hypothetical protein
MTHYLDYRPVTRRLLFAAVPLALLAACGGRTVVDLDNASPLECGNGRRCDNSGDGDGDGDTSGASGQGSGGSGAVGGAGSGGVGAVGGGGISGGSGIGGTAAFSGIGGISGGSGLGGVGGRIDLEACLGSDEATNFSCPQSVGPFEGACAPKGQCCRRSSNLEELAYLGPEEPQVFEYRFSQALITNHPLSMSLPILQMSAAERARYCGGDQCRLMRLTKPRSNGQQTVGSGLMQIGVGRYNCDGTYSFYDYNVAPVREQENLFSSDRWEARLVDTLYDPSAAVDDRIVPDFSSNPNQYVSCIPYFLPGTQTIDWEECSSGFELLQIVNDSSEGSEDCLGSWNGAQWSMPGRYQTFVPLADNNRDIIDSISQSYCQLLSFSVLAPEERDIDCLATPRCFPGNPGCKYVKLPDSLCPVDERERGLFRCHLGARDNPNDESDYPEVLPCTNGAPVELTQDGQCCDPMGQGSDGLPACNAFRMLYDFAASAAEITHEAKSEFPPVCN